MDEDGEDMEKERVRRARASIPRKLWLWGASEVLVSASPAFDSVSRENNLDEAPRRALPKLGPWLDRLKLPRKNSCP